MRFPLKFLPLSGVLSTLLFLTLMVTIHVLHYGKPARFITISDLARSFYVPETTIMAAGMTLEAVILFFNGFFLFKTVKPRYHKHYKLFSAFRYTHLLLVILGSFAMSCVGMFVVSGEGWKTPHNLSAGMFFIFSSLANILVIILDWAFISIFISCSRILATLTAAACMIAYSTSFPSKLAWDNFCEWVGLVLLFLVSYSTYFTFSGCRVEINIGNSQKLAEMPHIDELEVSFDSE